MEQNGKTWFVVCVQRTFSLIRKSQCVWFKYHHRIFLQFDEKHTKNILEFSYSFPTITQSITTNVTTNITTNVATNITTNIESNIISIVILSIIIIIASKIVYLVKYISNKLFVNFIIIIATATPLLLLVHQHWNQTTLPTSTKENK